MKDFLLVSSACVFVLSLAHLLAWPPASLMCFFCLFCLSSSSCFILILVFTGVLKSQDSEAVFGVPLFFSLLIHDGLTHLHLTLSPLFLPLLPFSLRLFSPSLYNPFVIFLGALFLYL